MTDATAIAEGLRAFNKIPGKPILASWMGASAVTEGQAILNASAIPTFEILIQQLAVFVTCGGIATICVHSMKRLR
jgi:acyl-CoA synthetase (NDP forming)